MSNLVQDCIFCKIIRNEISAYTVFENDDVKAFLDISQVTKGHVLIIPKKHLINFFDYSQEDAAKYLQYIPKIAQAIKASDKNIKGLNVFVNNGEIAGQVVMHSHIHLVPRYGENDGVNVPHINHAAEYTPEAYQEVANTIKQHLS